MSLTIDLPDDLAVELNADATALGLPLNEYALRLLANGRFRSLVSKNGAQLVERWRQSGTIGNRPEIADPVQ